VVTVIRDAETPQEHRWETRMGGDFVTHVLAHVQDELKISDQIHNELFDEPRVVTRVEPVILLRGLSHWKAAIVPRSEWYRRHGKDQPGTVRPRQGPQQRMETFLDAHHPKYMYHATKPPVQVFSRKDIEELGLEWSETYIHQEYPTVKRHWNGKTATVKNLDEQVALGVGWADTPTAFDPYKGPRPARTNQQDPAKWVDDWPVPGLSAEHRKTIKAQLLRADAAFWASPESASADLTSMKLAFDGVAKVLFEAGILTEQLLQGEIPSLVWDSAIAGGWYRFASVTPETIFPERLGHYYVWRDETNDWNGLFRAETAVWLATMLEAAVAAAPAPFKTPRPPKRSPKYQEIDKVLQNTAESRPKNHEEVFQALDRRTRVPNAEPFRSARGWYAGFQKDPEAARAWLSKRWGLLNLPRFLRGPK
jgi:hypothetical protein